MQNCKNDLHFDMNQKDRLNEQTQRGDFFFLEAEILRQLWAIKGSNQGPENKQELLAFNPYLSF